MTQPIKISNLNDTINRYKAGVSVAQLSRELGFSRLAITRALKAAGVDLRGQSDAERVKWAGLKANPKRVEKQMAAAWAARRGSSDREDTLVRRARTRQERKVAVHAGEPELAAALVAHGLQIEQQFAFGRYNLDIAIAADRIAVEVVGSNWHPHHVASIRKRTEHILGEGWAVVFVFAWRREPGLVRDRDSGNRFLPPRRVKPVYDPAAVAEYMVAFAERLRGDEALRGKYGVISGNAEPLTVVCDHLDGLPAIPHPQADQEPPLHL